MFRCLICHRFSSLPRCVHCGSIYETSNGIYQLTRDPNLNLDDTKGVKYLGYDRVGSYYGEKKWINCSPTNMLIGGKMAELTHRGMLLDLGCGYGTYSVPAALHGCTVIAGDISGVMLGSWVSW
jgi:SAM-dependent methyltransferase